MFKKILFLISLILVLSPAFAYAENKAETENRVLYVNINTGNDSLADGSLDNPYKTLTKAIESVSKNIETYQVKIRVMQGDYRSEGTINIHFFKGGMLKVVAFDGSNEIETPNDNYIFAGFNIRNSDFIHLFGFKVINPNQSGYGIFIERTGMAEIRGYKNDDGSLKSNSGIGVTQNSSVILDNAYISNRSAVVSCNWGSKVISKNWHQDSKNNIQGLIAQGGGQIHLWDSTSPEATYQFLQKTGGFIVDEKGNKLFDKSSFQTYVSRDANLETDWVIPIDLSSKPTTLMITSTLGTKIIGNSQYVNGKSFSISQDEKGNAVLSYDLLYLRQNDSAIKFKIKSLQKDKIILSVEKQGNLTGNIGLSIIASTQ